MKEWIGYYENVLSDEISDGIMNLKVGNNQLIQIIKVK